MSALGVRDLWERVRAGFAGGGGRWLARIPRMIPERLRQALRASDSTIAIDVLDQEVVIRRFSDDGETVLARMAAAAFDAAALRGALAPMLARPWIVRDVFALRLDDSQALRRTLRLPFAARRQLNRLVPFEVERLSPIDSRLVYYDYRIVSQDRSANHLDVVLRIARQEAVDAALAVCRAAGIGVAVVAFAGDATPAQGGTLPADAKAAVMLKLRRWLVPGLAALAVGLALGVVGAEYGRRQAVADELAGRVAQAQSDLQAVRLLHRQIDDARKRSAFLAHQKQSPLTVQILREVTRVLPEDSWLFEIELHGNEVRIRGLSRSAASLIALFDASPMFVDAQFRAPLMQGADAGFERFDMSFRLRDGGA